MKIQFIKSPGGVLIPASDMEVDKMSRFITGEQYEAEIKLSRNPAFHRKVFKFFEFCFEFWKGDNEFQSESKQFDVFRNHLTVLAGFYETYSGINNSVRIEAKSLSFSSMTQNEFEECYTALIGAACKHIFDGADKETEDKLISFF